MSPGFFGKAHFPPAEFPRFSADADKCTRCGRCVKVCPTHILALGQEGPPRIQGYKGLEVACIGCRNCVAVCKDKAASVDGNYRVSAGRYRTLYSGRTELPNPFRDSEPPPFESAEPRLTETERVILKRRSNRLFKKDPVPEALLHRVIEAGRYAPSSGNGRAWEFVVIRDQELIRRIETACLKSLKLMSGLYLRPGNIVTRAFWDLYSLRKPGDMDIRVMTGMDTVVEHGNLYFNAPAVIVILADERGIGQPVLDAGICAQNMVIAAHAMGLGSCYVGFITALNKVPDRKLMKEIGAVWPMRIATSIAFGFPQGEIDRAVPRERPKVTWL